MEEKPFENTQDPIIIGQSNIQASAVKQRHLVSQPTQTGDMYYGQDGNSFANLPIGTAGQVLGVVNGVPSWVTSSTSPVVDGGTYIKPITNGDSFRSYDSGGTKYIDIKHDGTNAIVTSSSGNLILEPATSGLVEIAVLRQNITSNVYVPHAVILTGWSFVTGTGAATIFDKAITFGITFTGAPTMSNTLIGYKDSSDPTAITDFSVTNFVDTNAQSCNATSITTTGFTAQVGGNANLVNGRRFGFSWTAIGAI